MAKLSPAREAVPVLNGILLINRGKVRDTYDLGRGLLLSVATDGISIFDFVLDALIPGKGMVLTAMTHFWMKKLEEAGICKTHLVAAGKDIDDSLPEALRGNPELQSRSLVVRALKMSSAEFIARGYLTGSVLKEYKKTGKVFGMNLPAGLEDGDKLPFVLDTPTTKAVLGHDMPMSRTEVHKQFGYETEILFDVYKFVRKFAQGRGIIFADTKLEFGHDGNGDLILGDEVATPDSSRFWSAVTWKAGRKSEVRKAPPPYDKQMVRDFGIANGVDGKLNPEDQRDITKAQSLVLSDDLIRATTGMYNYIFWLLTGMRVHAYVASNLGVSIEVPKRKIAIVFGSESDIPRATTALTIAEQYRKNGHLKAVDVHILSCHRNPLELEDFVKKDCHGADAVIAAGSMAFALPGVLDAFLYAHGKRIPVIGVALGERGSIALRAAALSISELPGRPVVMSERTGVYVGEEGLREAITRVTFGEMPPIVPRTKKYERWFINYSPKV